MLKRTLIGLTVLLVLIAAYLFDESRSPEPAVATAVLGAILMLGSLDELLRLGGAKPGRRQVGRLLGIAWLAILLLPALVPDRANQLAGDVLNAGSLVAAIFLALQVRGGPGPMAHRMAGSLWFQVPYVGGIACLVALLLTGALHYAVYVTIAAKASDIGAYFGGSAFGRHKLAPRISPNKTWEGAIGGLLLPAVVGAFLLNGVELRPERVLPGGQVLPAALLSGGMMSAALHGLVIGALAVVSDLSESVLKRSRGAKDSGRVFGQAGGFLDLADSLLLVGPCALAYTAVLS